MDLKKHYEIGKCPYFCYKNMKRKYIVFFFSYFAEPNQIHRSNYTSVVHTYKFALLKILKYYCSS